LIAAIDRSSLQAKRGLARRLAGEAQSTRGRYTALLTSTCKCRPRRKQTQPQVSTHRDDGTVWLTKGQVRREKDPAGAKSGNNRGARWLAGRLL